MSKTQRINQGDLKNFRIGFWDIESSGLAASFGGMFCATVKPLGGKPVTFRIDKTPTYKDAPWDDWILCKQVRDELETYQVMIGYNSVAFDLPFLNTRLVAHRERVV